MKFLLQTAAVIALSTGAVAAQDWNVDVFGGLTFENDLEWDSGQYDTNAGSMFGVGISKSNVFAPNIEVGLEVSYSESVYSGNEPNYISGLAVMATVEYNFISNGDFEAYGGIGLGAVNVTYDNSALSDKRSEVVFGGQVVLGARYAVSDTMQIFVEGRYLDTFSDAVVARPAPSTATAEYNVGAVVAGLRIGF
ncbi:MAG: porin family protein [Rhodobacteraceae bacterium]|nr:porin family protein [Paracoccaceae bacterium]